MSAIAIAPPIESVAPAPVTPEEMLRLPDDGKLYELVDGELVEKVMSDFAEFLANRLKMLIDVWAVPAGRGNALVGAGFRCFPFSPAMVRRPDVAYISSERLAAYTWGRGFFAIPPDLAIEVVSPHDEVIELDRKISDYFQAGVKRVWVINPDLKIVRTHRAMGDLSELVGDAVLSDDLILPGFQCPLATLFASPSPVAEPK